MTQPKKLINSVDRAMKIIHLFDEQKPEWKLSEISRELDLHKSTVHGLLRTLAHHGYIEQNPETEKYRLGLRFLEKSTYVLNHLDLRGIAAPHLKEIAKQYGESTHLALLDEGEAIYIDKVEGASAISMYSRIGKRAPLYCTAVGKVLISEKDHPTVSEYAAQQSYKVHTVNTISSKEEFIQEISKVTAQGYALDNEELEIGLRCAAVPIYNNRGELIAAMSISGPSSRLTGEQLDRVIADLKSHAASISSKLGWI